MDYWFLENLEKLVPIVIALLYFLGTSRAKKKAQEEGASAPDSDADERARRIQEEIRRKILERQQRGSPSAQRVEPPELPVRDVEQPLHPESSRSFRDTANESQPSSGGLDIPAPFFVEPAATDFYEIQRKEAEARLRKSREIAAKARADDIGTAYELPANIKTQARFAKERRIEYLEGLQDAESIRHAIVLKEILDVPVSLR